MSVRAFMNATRSRLSRLVRWSESGDRVWLGQLDGDEGDHARYGPLHFVQGDNAARLADHAAVCLSAFQAFSPISVVKQRVWPNVPSFSWYTFELIITYLTEPSFARSRAG
jgi:hypothetical protein